MSRRLATRFEHAYFPPVRVAELRCQTCEHWFGNENRCGLIRAECGEVRAEGCCRMWFGGDVLEDLYGVHTKKRPKAMRAPDLGRLMTKGETAFVDNVDAIDGCRDCVYFTPPGTCSTMGAGLVDPRGACRWWRNPTIEAEDDRFFNEIKAPPPEADRSWVSSLRAILARFLGGA